MHRLANFKPLINEVLNMRMTLRLLSSIGVAILVSGSLRAQPSPSEWSSAPCSSVALGPSSNVSHIQRVFFLAGKNNTIQYKFFADEKCTLGLFSIVIKGGIELGRPVMGLEGTVDIKVAIDRVLFTLDSPRGSAAAKSCADGNFEVGVQRDVTESGCMFIKPKSACGVDHDIMKIKDGLATPGFRTADMCKPEGRPTTLQSAGVKYLQAFPQSPAPN
jgi:hypothetical protein